MAARHSGTGSSKRTAKQRSKQAGRKKTKRAAGPAKKAKKKAEGAAKATAGTSKKAKGAAKATAGTSKKAKTAKKTKARPTKSKAHSKKASKKTAARAKKASKKTTADAKKSTKRPRSSSEVVKKAVAGARKKKTAARANSARSKKPTVTAASNPSARSEPARQQSLFNDAGTAPAPGVGNLVPEFALSDQNGDVVSSTGLMGTPYVLYFYPKDDTTGCTKEACNFRDELAEFTKAGYRVIGVSPDSTKSHEKFANKYGLNFTLLSDPEKSLSSGLGVWQLKKNYGREYMGIVRSTFLVDQSGVIRRAWRKVRVAGHVPEVIMALAD